MCNNPYTLFDKGGAISKMIMYTPFWDTLKSKEMTTYTLINKYNVSSSTINRLRHNHPISTTTIDDLCRILDCQVNEIIEFLYTKY